MRNAIFYGLLLCVFVSLNAQELSSGISKSGFDLTVKPQDNFYQYVNGTWLETTVIPEDKSNYGSFTVLADAAEKNLKAIIDAAAGDNAIAGSDAQKVGDMYRSFMDTTLIEKSGINPIRDDLQRITAINNYDDIAIYMAESNRMSVQSPFVFFIDQDPKNSTEYIGFFHQSGLGMPDKSYYFDDKFAETREKYVAYIQQLLNLANDASTSENATKIMAIETEIAKHHWTRVENRDRDKTYNKFASANLSDAMPKFNWNAYLQTAGLTSADAFIVRQPSFFAGLDSVLLAFPVSDWQSYFTFKLIDAAAPFLSNDFVNARFEFRGKVLSGVTQNRPRWKRGVDAVESTLGEVLGRLYVEKHFKPKAKARMTELVHNLSKAFEIRINNLEWMSAETKKQALEKLSKFNFKIGYPDKWKDYSTLEIKPNELLQNMKRSAAVEYQREVSKLGNPIDRSEWFMTPQTVNAYYNPPMNEVVFPAAILQPPFFDMAADDAVNYGAIGAVIGHEFSHGFDDQGRKSDGNGNLRDWWTESDAENFSTRAKVMIEQYNGYSPIDSMNVNGELTLGENIADLAGLTVAYEAYSISLNGKPAAEIDGFTGQQRFFLGWGQIWRRKYREAELRQRLLTDPHSPSEYRVNGIVSNMPTFYEAFGVQPADAMYRSKDVRVQLW